ncbi:hypothetical protein ILUMI_06138 [Ignelater luminosus]|uniref:HTH psq-type domain-containing protein n=1 Tax=Ignelater luminosus TaxID=2038154 RepID=A0A8K0D6C8_IGNLU|nr:hypothetical protein ILUMI_06138 [Ignelater luminosus]
MPRNYKRKTNRQSWSVDCLTRALQEVFEGRMGYKKAARTFSVPQSTLEDRVKKVSQRGLFPASAAEKCLGRFQTVFTEAQETELGNHILFLEERLFGLTLHDLQRLAFEPAERNNLPNSFNKTTQMAGKDWLYGFLNRHHNISLRDPEKTSIARAKKFNHTAVSKFYDLLNSIYEKHNLSSNDIYNVDETGLYKQSKVLALQEKTNEHTSHSKSVALIDLALENNVTLLCFPPHTIHRLQPLDVSFMAPLSAYYEQELRKWLVAHPGRAVTIYQIGKLFTVAFTRAAVMQTAIAGLKKTVIYPFNRDVFPEHLFAPSETTKRPQTAEILQTPKDLEPQPSRFSCGSLFSISPRMLMPPPQEEQRVRTKNNRIKGKTAILTFSPYKLELKKEEQERQE